MVIDGVLLPENYQEISDIIESFPELDFLGIERNHSLTK